MKTKWDNLSIRGRTAYAIMACERYILRYYPDRDMTPVARYMWDIVNDTADIDGHAYRFLDIVPEYLYEADSYEKSEMEEMTKEEYDNYLKILPTAEDDPDLNTIMHRIYHITMEYVYTCVRLDEPETKEYLQEIDEILIRHGIELPDVKLIPEYVPDDSNGWGDFIDDKALSLILKD